MLQDEHVSRIREPGCLRQSPARPSRHCKRPAALPAIPALLDAGLGDYPVLLVVELVVYYREYRLEYPQRGRKPNVRYGRKRQRNAYGRTRFGQSEELPGDNSSFTRIRYLRAVDSADRKLLLDFRD